MGIHTLLNGYTPVCITTQERGNEEMNIPGGWERKPLLKVAEIRTGVAKGKKGLKDPIKVPYLRVANVQDGYIDLSEVKTIEIERHQLERYSLQKGDVLMTEGGDFDKLGRGDVWQGQIAPCLNQNHVFAVRVNREKLVPYFLATLSGSHYGKTYFLSCAKRSTNLASINSTQLKEFPVLIPPLPEQQKIAKILTTWDKAISTTEALIDNSKQQKKALMQQLLTGKKRFAGFEGEWEEVNLEKVVKITGGNAFKSEFFEKSGTPLIRISNIKTDYSINFNSAVYLPLNTKADKFKVIKGNVLIAMSGATTGKIGRYSFNKYAFLNQRVGRFDIKKSLITEDYLFQLLKLPKIQYEILVDAVGGAQPNISNKDIERIKTHIPPVEEQQKIASVLINADEEIELLTQQLADLKQEKKALMQQLLTGKRRVKVDEVKAA